LHEVGRDHHFPKNLQNPVKFTHVNSIQKPADTHSTAMGCYESHKLKSRCHLTRAVYSSQTTETETHSESFTGALAASILLIVRLTTRTNSDSVAHNHIHSLTNNADIAIGFEKLLDGEASQPIAALNSLSKTFDGREAAIDESETELGYEPSISQALPSGVKLVSNRILKLPPCNCTADECSCGSARCICAASLCKRVDGSEFLVIEHCETQNVSFGHLRSEVLRDEN